MTKTGPAPKKHVLKILVMKEKMSESQTGAGNLKNLKGPVTSPA